MENNGWVKVHRKMLENPLCKSPEWAWVWICLLLMANHEESSFIWNGKAVKLKPGQFLTGRKKIADAAKVSESLVEKILNYLETEQQIKQMKTTKFRVITILNWDTYQNNESKSNNSVTTARQQRDTYKNEKNDKKKKEDTSASADAFTQFWDAYPKKELKKKTEELWKTKKLDSHLPEILRFVVSAKNTDRWKKGYIKAPPVFLRGECWNDDLTSYNDSKVPLKKIDNVWHASNNTQMSEFIKSKTQTQP